MKQNFFDITLYVILIVLALITHGYHYGWGNHAALIPAIYHIVDSSYLANDLQAGDFPWYIRALTWPIAQMSKVIPLPLLMFIFQIISPFLLFFAIKKLAEALLPEQPLFGWFVIFILIVLRYFIPGENLIIGRWVLFEQTFYMYTLGYAVSLLALLFLVRGKIVWAGVIGGLTIYTHLNQGEHILLLISGCLLLSPGGIRDKARNFFIFVGISLLISAPVVVATLYDEVLAMLTSQPAYISGVNYYDVFHFRLRNHLMPSSWPLSHHVMFVLQIFATWYVFRKRKQIAWKAIDRVSFRIFNLVIILCGLGYANEWLKIDFIDKSFFFRTSVFSCIISVMYFCWVLWQFVFNKIKTEKLQKYSRYVLAGLSLYVVIAFLLSYMHPELFTGWRAKIYPGITFDINQTPLEEYVKANTPRDAIFLVSPHYFNFSVNTHRAQVVNWMAIPFNKDSFRKWYERIVDLTGGKTTVESVRHINDNWVILDSAEAAYFRLTPDKIVAVAKKYNADYCIFSNHLPFEAEYRWNDLTLYKIR